MWRDEAYLLDILLAARRIRRHTLNLSRSDIEPLVPPDAGA